MADYFESKTYPIPCKLVADAVISPAFAAAMNYRLTNTIPGPAGYTYRFLHNVSALSWGEEIDITLSPAGDDSTHVKVRSSCGFIWMIFNSGKNQENVNAIWNYIERNLLAQYNSPKMTQATSFCGNCGAPLETGNAFCTKCGKSVG